MQWYYATELRRLGITAERTVPAAALLDSVVVERYSVASHDAAGEHNEMLVELARMAAPAAGMPASHGLQAQVIAEFLKTSAPPSPIVFVPHSDQVYSFMLQLQRCASAAARVNSYGEFFSHGWQCYQGLSYLLPPQLNCG